MNITDEMLMAFADDELDAATRETVQAAMRRDPSIAERIARHRALRGKLQQGFAAELDAPVPERLLLAARGGIRPAASTIRAPVADIDTARASSEAIRSSGGAAWRRRPLMAMAASLVLGLALGMFVPRYSGSLVSKDGVLVAHGVLARALSVQLGGEPSSGVQIGVSFRSKSGEYCRTFLMKDAASPSGLACYRAAEWQIQMLQAADGSSADATQYRTAGSSMPAAILSAVQQRIDGDALDEPGEVAARRQGWAPIH